MTPCDYRERFTRCDAAVSDVRRSSSLRRTAPQLPDVADAMAPPCKLRLAGNLASDVLVQQQRFDEAASYTAEGVEIDPLFDLAWVLRARYYLGTGDIPAAEAAAEEAKGVQALYPEGSADPALVESLVNDIALAKEQAG